MDSLAHTITEDDLANTRIGISCTIEPVKHVLCDLSGILGRFSEDLLKAFYPPIVGKRTNIVITELVNNVLENILLPDSAVTLEILVDAQHLVIRVTNAADEQRYEKVASHVRAIMECDDVKRLMRQTIRDRRVGRLKGGIGLMRLVAENKFQIHTEFHDGKMTVESRLAPGELS